MNTRHGFLTRCSEDDMVCSLIYDGKEPIMRYTEGPDSLDQYIGLAIYHHFTHLWVMPGFATFDDVSMDTKPSWTRLNEKSWKMLDDHYDIMAYASKEDRTKISSLVGRTVSPRTPNVKVIFLEHTPWPCDGDVDRFYRLVNEIETTLGVQMYAAPASIGLRYLEKVDNRYYKRYFEKPEGVDWKAFTHEGFVPAIGWLPVPSEEVLSKKYLHCFDRNASQPYAAVQAKFGIGKPVVHEGAVFSHLVPGFWDVTVRDYENVDKRLPPLIPTGKRWLHTKLVKMLITAGCHIYVNMAYIWPEEKNRAPVFSRWGTSLFDLRQKYPAASPEREVIKQIMNGTIGSLRTGLVDESTYRPDWYATILAEERAVVWYKAWKIAKDYGVYPFGCYADALYYASDEAEPAIAVPTILNHPTSMGGYKHVYTLPIDERVVDILTTTEKSRRAPGIRIGFLKDLAREAGYVR